MNAQQLKNSILQEAIEGRLVPQDPNDEPASVLLERIRKEKAKLVKEGKLKKKDLEEIVVTEDEKTITIPDTWIWCRLGDIGVFERGNGIKRDETTDKGYPCVRYGEMYTKYRKAPTFGKTFSFTSAEVFEKCRKAHKGDLFMALTGENKQDISLAAQYIGEDEVAVGGDLCHFTVLSAYPLFFVYLINSKFFSNKKELLASGDIIVHISTDKLASIPIPLPPFEEQHRIVAKIEELLPKVEAYGKAQEALDKLNADLPEQLKKSILQEAIEGRLVPQDPNEEPASVLLEKIRKEKKRLVKEGKLKKKDLEEIPISKEEIPFEIPESWEWCRFGTVVKTYTGKTPERGNADYWCNEDYPWVSISDMKQGETLTTTKERISSKAAERCFGNHLSPKGSLIMSFKLTVGRTTFLGVDAFHNEAIITIETLSDPEFNTRNYYSHILPLISNWGDSKDAIKGKTLNSKSIYNLLIPMPPYKEQHRIVAKIEQLINEINKLKE